MKLFALSDHHFGHQNIIKYCDRKTHEIPNPNLSALEDAKAMILAHNEVVQDDDLVVFGGDIQASKQGREWIAKIIAKLKGRKILVRGNHDHFTNEEYIQMGFESVHDILTIDEFCFCHYPDVPLAVDICQKKNLTLCCGPTHKEFRDYGDGVKRINLCVDVAGRTPILLKEFPDS